MRAHTLALVALCLATTADAQGRRFFGTLAVGPALPIGAFGDAFDMGFSVAAGVGTALANKNVEVRATASYGSFGLSGSGMGVDGTSTPFTITGDILYQLGEAGRTARPYLVGGAGIASVGYSSSYDGAGTGGGENYSERDTGLTFGGGAGLLMQRGRTGFFVEGRLVAISGSSHSHLPVTVGLRINPR